MTPEEYRVDRDELISETIAGASGNNAIRTELWYEGHLIAYIVITVSDPTGRTIGRLDCAHGTIHTHFWGHTPIDEVRTTYATIPADPRAGEDPMDKAKQGKGRSSTPTTGSTRVRGGVPGTVTRGAGWVPGSATQVEPDSSRSKWGKPQQRTKAG